MPKQIKDIAIIGHACRFPGGADSPEKFWNLLITGQDAVTSLPLDRFEQRNFLHPDPATPGRAYTFAAGTLGDVSGFDAGFFGVSPREAAQIDPQQRLLLELTWEALERGGSVPDRLSGTQCAVYVGISSTDYSDRRMGDAETSNAYFMLGAALSIAANRISYIFDLNGPSLAIDTACSSSLVALHEAVHALRGGRAPMAIVGGVNLLLSPYPYLGFSKAGMLAPYGRCRAFDKVAQGYVRAEGGGVVVLKPLADAERDGDPIVAVIRAVGTNADGRTHGIALPSSQSQEALLNKVYREARIAARDVSYIEAHGTGTAVGDPAEAGALGRAIGRRRPKSEPLLIGSVKTNIGHLEPAAGMAGLIKSIEILRHRMVPPTLHQDEPNPDIAFNDLGLRVVAEPTPLPHHNGRSIIGVNSFGFGGANAHVVIESYIAPVDESPAKGESGARLPFTLSARSDAALAEMARRTIEMLGADDTSAWRDIAYTATCRRAHHEHRLILHARNAAEARAELGSYLAGDDAVPSSTVVQRDADVALVFVGNGSQWQGMGTRLYAEDAVFRATIEKVESVARWRLGWSIAQVFRGEAEPAMDDTRIAQPLLLALQIGVLESMKARGLKFGAVLGHSVGEVAAAYAAGALSLEQAFHVIRERSNAQGKTRGHGRMMAVSLGAEAAAAEIESFEGAIEIAAINSPRAVTLSGDLEALQALDESLKAREISHQLLDLDYAFHSRMQDPTRDDVLKGLADLAPRAAALPFYSAVTGDKASGSELDAEYWWRNIRQPVRYGDAIACLARDGFRLFVEIGPHPLLQGYMHQQLKALKIDGQPVPTLNKSDDGAGALDRAADRAYVLGADLAFETFYPRGGKVVLLPTYPFQRERHWAEPTSEARGSLLTRHDGPLLGSRAALQLPVWENHFDTGLFPFLADHQVGGSVVVPAAAYVEMALEAALQLFGEAPVDLEEIEILRPLVLDPGQFRVVRFSYTEEGGHFVVESRPHLAEQGWSLHVKGRLGKALASAMPLPAVLDEPVHLLTGEDHYAFASSRGFDYGPAFQVVSHAQVSPDGALVALVPGTQSEVLAQCRIDPSLLDGALQGVFAILRDRAGNDGETSYIPQKIGRLLFHPNRGTPVLAEVALERQGPRSLVARAVLRDENGEVVAEMRALRLMRIELRRRGRESAQLYRTDVVPLVPLDPEPVPTECLYAAYDVIAGNAARSVGVDYRATLDRVATAFAADALIALGDGAVPGGREEAVANAIALVESVGDVADSLSVWSDSVRDHPELIAELTLLARAFGAFAAKLKDKDAPAVPSTALYEHLYDSGPAFAPGNDALAETIRSVIETWPVSRRLRVLELGAGTGGFSHRLLAALPAGRFDLVLLDQDDDAVAGLKARFAANSDVRVVQADFAAPATHLPDLPGHGFDLIVGAYALMDCADRSAALDALGTFAAPGALVLLAEAAPAAWLDFAIAALSGGAALPHADAFRAHAEHAKLRDVAVEQVDSALILSASAPEAVSEIHAEPVVETKPWVLLVSPSDVAIADALASALMHKGQHVLRVDTAARDVEGWANRWSDILRRQGTPRGLIHLAGLSATSSRTGEMLALQRTRCADLVTALQGLKLANPEATLEVVLVTQNVFALKPSEATDPGQAALAGLARVLRNELSAMGCRLVDLHPAGGVAASLAQKLAGEILSPPVESEVLLTPNARHGLRIVRAGREERVISADTIDVLATKGGSLDNLAWEARLRPALGDDEVEIAIAAAGLNFRDVMFALGVLPDEVLEGGYAGASLGMEGAGVVTRVGASISDLAAGDRVICFAPATLASHTVTKRFAVGRLPDGVSFAAGATMTAAFFTVVYALETLGRLSAGERVLIHGAAGGVGIAAIQYARHVGAEIFATAGSDEKRQIVELHGVPADHIFDSRSTAFADQILTLTNGEGIDAVLNSIAGDAVTKSLSLLRPFGRFLELGKVDFIANSRIGLRGFRNNISYFGIDADQLMAGKPALSRKVFARLEALFAEGAFRPLPYRVFPREQTVEAFRHLQQSRHIGKIVLEIGARAPAPAKTSVRPAAIVSDATYLVTGGVRGFGLATAQWLADKGARHLVLVSRSGAPDATSATAIEAMKARGVTVDLRACDVGNQDEVGALIDQLATSSPPLRGIVHAAAVYDDVFAMDLTPERLNAVLAPKLGGAWALHCATASQPLDFFLMYSSISAVIGNPGQANYVAANLFLESLTGLRRSRGLPATLAILPPVADAGYLTRNEDVAEALAKLGVRPIATTEVFGYLDRLLEGEGDGTFFADMEWRKLGALPALGAAKFKAVASRGADGATVDGHADLATLARELGPEGLNDLLLELLTRQIGGILRVAPEKLDTERSIFDLGMDSLMGLELRMSIAEEFGIELSPMALSQDVSIRRVAEMLCDHVLGRKAAAPSVEALQSAAESEASAILSRHDEVVEAGDIERAMQDLAKVPPAERGRLIQ